MLYFFPIFKETYQIMLILSLMWCIALSFQIHTVYKSLLIILQKGTAFIIR